MSTNVSLDHASMLDKIIKILEVYYLKYKNVNFEVKVMYFLLSLILFHLLLCQSILFTLFLVKLFK